MSLQTDVNTEYIKYLNSITNEKGKRAFTGRDLNKLLRWESQDPRLNGLLETAANSIENYQEAIDFKKELQTYFTKPLTFTADRDGNLIVLGRAIPEGQEGFGIASPYNIEDIRLAPGLIAPQKESLTDMITRGVAETFTLENLKKSLSLRNLGRAAGFAFLAGLPILAGCATVQADDYNAGGAPGKIPQDDSISKLPQKAIKQAPQMNHGGLVSRHTPSRLRFNNYMAFDLENSVSGKNTPDFLLHELPSLNLTWYRPLRLLDSVDFLVKAELNAAGLGTMYNDGKRKSLGEFKVMDDGSIDLSLGYNLGPLFGWDNSAAKGLTLPDKMFSLGVHGRGRHVDLKDANVKKEQYLEFGLDTMVLYGPFQMRITTDHAFGNMSQRKMKNGYSAKDKARNFGRVEISYNLPGFDVMAHLAGGKIERDVRGPENFTARETEELIEMGGSIILPNKNGQYAGLVFRYMPWQKFETDKPAPGENGKSTSSHAWIGLTAGSSLGGLLRTVGANVPKNSILNDFYVDIETTYGNHSNFPNHDLNLITSLTYRFR